MVKLVRVDHRLLHGQVVFIWTASIGVDCILIANDDVANDPIQKGILKLSQPTGVKLIFKSVKDSIEALNSGITDKYNLMIITSNVDDGYELASKVEQIRSLNLGNVKLTGMVLACVVAMILSLVFYVLDKLHLTNDL